MMIRPERTRAAFHLYMNLEGARPLGKMLVLSKIRLEKWTYPSMPAFNILSAIENFPNGFTSFVYLLVKKATIFHCRLWQLALYA